MMEQPGLNALALWTGLNLRLSLMPAPEARGIGNLTTWAIFLLVSMALVVHLLRA